MQDAVTTFLFTDIEGSTRLWEQEPERMRPALARHDDAARHAVHSHSGQVVKMTGDGLHAAFEEPLAALQAALQIQLALADPSTTAGLELRIRCGLHAGPHHRRDNDFYGTHVNRAARIMGAAHGGQVLVSQALANLLPAALPDGTSLRDLGSVRLRDLSGPERLFQVVHPRLRAEFPPLHSLEETPNNLPQALSSFVGREAEMARVGELLREHRLVTVLGMGGLGKTRLSLHVAAEALEDHADGVWLVELAAVTEASRVAQAIATVLGVKECAGGSVEDALVRHVRERRMLIVLDNCEHVLRGAAAIVHRLLTAAAGLRVLATSREPLRIAGEFGFPLVGLPVAAGIPPTAASRYEAVRLFVDRARAARPDFRLTDENAAAVVAICHRLDGIPLAIELAAARTRSIPPDEIASRLKDRFRLLRSGDPTTVPRQRTLRALVDWSHDMLPGDERHLFRQLAVFSGGWTLEAAEQVCGPSSGEDLVLDLLSGLVEKSLVMHDEGDGRYRMLDTVRQYAWEHLEDSGEAACVRDAHLAYFVRFAEAAKPRLSGPEQGAWLERLDQERGNILAAHDWAQLGARTAKDGLRLVNAMKLYWINRGLLALGRGVTVHALSNPGAQPRDLIRCLGLFHAGQLSYWMGLYREARELLGESLSIARQLGDQRGIATVLQPLGMAAMAEGDPAAARGCLEEALALARAQGEKRQLAGALNALAQLERVEGRSQATGAMYEQVIELAREAGDEESAAIGRLNLAMVLVMQGNLAAARTCLLDVLAVAERLRSRPVAQSQLEVCAGLSARVCDWRTGARLFGAAEAQALETGVRRDPADEAFLAPSVERIRAALGDAAFAAEKSAGSRLGFDAALREARHWLEGVVATARPAASEPQ